MNCLVAAAGTSPGSHPPNKLPQAAQLSQEADTQVRALLDLLKQQQQAAGADAGGASRPLSGPLLIVLVKALSTLAVARPSLMGRVLPTLLALAKEV